MGGLLAAVLLTKLVRGSGRRVAASLAFAVTGGLAVTGILQFWFGSIAGSYPANAGAVALSIAAVSLTVVGLESMFGYAGIGIGAVVMMLIGNPLSGTATAPRCCRAGPAHSGSCCRPGPVDGYCDRPRSSTAAALSPPSRYWSSGPFSGWCCA